ncbi:MAG: XRE family transcriptional regulator [Armatimonadetes bacterium]|nr:XRE family transcriptional regulator [Armatimonadota bacterium]MDW8121780.1 XRE family transcriptional regulator [Armatimonadota bacterium]
MARKGYSVTVNGLVLRWARETIGATEREVAKRVGTTEAVVKNWETGDVKLSLRQLKKLSAFFRRPLAALLLPKPPPEPALPQDFRRLPGKPPGTLSRQAHLVIRKVRRLQTIAAELLDQLGDKEKRFRQPARDPSGDPENIAKEIRVSLGISVDAQKAWSNPQMAFAEWRKAIESQNVLVFQMSFPLEDGRGFSLAHERLPVIVVNQRDAVTARIFTLIHEYAHLLIRVPGICGPELEDVAGDRSADRIEVFCNRLAAAILVPPEDLRDTARALKTSDLLHEARRIAYRVYKVSPQVLLRRLCELGFIPYQAYRQARDAEKTFEEQLPKRVKKPPAHMRCLRELGRPFVSLVLEASDKEIITTRDASDLLSLNLDQLRTLHDALRQPIPR